MKRIIKLTESDLTRIVKRVIKEEYHENIETTSDDDLRSKLDSYKSEMENFLRELKSSGTEIDKHRFLKQVQKETDQMYWDVYDNSDSEPEGFVELQMDLIKHFRKKLNESYRSRVVKENNAPERYVIDLETGEMVGTHKYGVGFVVNRIGERMGYESHPTSIPNGTKMERYNDYKEDFPSLRNRKEMDLNEMDSEEKKAHVDGLLRNVIRGFDTEKPKDFTEILSDISDLIDDSESAEDFNKKYRQFAYRNKKDLNRLNDDEKNQLDSFINSIMTRHGFN